MPREGTRRTDAEGRAVATVDALLAHDESTRSCSSSTVGSPEPSDKVSELNFFPPLPEPSLAATGAGAIKSEHSNGMKSSAGSSLLGYMAAHASTESLPSMDGVGGERWLRTFSAVVAGAVTNLVQVKMEEIRHQMSMAQADMVHTLGAQIEEFKEEFKLGQSDVTEQLKEFLTLQQLTLQEAQSDKVLKEEGTQTDAAEGLFVGSSAFPLVPARKPGRRLSAPSASSSAITATESAAIAQAQMQKLLINLQTSSPQHRDRQESPQPSAPVSPAASWATSVARSESLSSKGSQDSLSRAGDLVLAATKPRRVGRRAKTSEEESPIRGSDSEREEEGSRRVRFSEVLSQAVSVDSGSPLQEAAAKAVQAAQAASQEGGTQTPERSSSTLWRSDRTEAPSSFSGDGTPSRRAVQSRTAPPTLRKGDSLSSTKSFFTGPSGSLARSMTWSWKPKKSEKTRPDQMNLQNLEALHTQCLFEEKGLAPASSSSSSSSMATLRREPSSSHLLPIAKAALQGAKGREEAAELNQEIDHCEIDLRRSPTNESLLMIKVPTLESSSSGCRRGSTGGWANNVTTERLKHMELVRRETNMMAVSNDKAKVFAWMFADSDQEDAATSMWMPQLALVMAGILPSSNSELAKWGTYLLSLPPAAAAVYYLAMLGIEPTRFCQHMAASFLAFGALLGCISLRRVQCIIGPAASPLIRFAEEHYFVDKWGDTSNKRLAWSCSLWVLTVLVRAVHSVVILTGAHHCSTPGQTGVILELMGLGAFAIVSALFIAVAFCHLHVLGGLEMMVDNYCISFFLNPDCASGVAAWNVLQAMLRRVAGVVDGSFLLLQTSSAVSTLLLFGWILSAVMQMRAGKGKPGDDGMVLEVAFWLVELIPSMCLACYAAFVFLKGAAVTEKCVRVPSLVNSLNYDKNHLNQDRQYIVQYIRSSSAGFYVKGVCLTAYMIMKLAYFCGALAFGMTTTLFSLSGTMR